VPGQCAPALRAELAGSHDAAWAALATAGPSLGASTIIMPVPPGPCCAVRIIKLEDAPCDRDY
jgi:hypothetical protein